MAEAESPHTVHGRLLEAVHISGYTLERALNECVWLLKDNRWKQIGRFKSPSEFVRSIDLSAFRITAEQRKEIAKLLADEDVSQRATAKMLGVSEPTIARTSGKSRGATNVAGDDKKAAVVGGPSTGSATNVALPPYDPDLAGGQKAAAAQQVKAARAEREQQREERRQENAAKVATVTNPRELLKVGRFSTIVIDPPWDLGDEGDVNQLGRAKQDYASLSFDQLLTQPVDVLADADCHLYLWITNRSLPKGFRLIEAWGFRYVTCLTWVKPSFGMGNYFRGQTEHVLFAIRGSLALKRADAATVFHASRGEDGHSSKPEEFYELVESCSPGPYLDMFTRRVSDGGLHTRHLSGWVPWGEESNAA
jgi:N6-adenosine-specific RNA methylase IME4